MRRLIRYGLLAIFINAFAALAWPYAEAVFYAVRL